MSTMNETKRENESANWTFIKISENKWKNLPKRYFTLPKGLKNPFWGSPIKSPCNDFSKTKRWRKANEET